MSNATMADSMFTPILSEATLPVRDRDHETLHLDFKATAEGSSTWEKAKDAAAFANAQGGTILVSAAEDKKRGHLGTYVFLTAEEAADAVRAYDEAIRTRCRPQPVFDTRSFVVEDKGHAVAVNVWPFIGQPVGVKPNLPPGYSDVDAYSFPVRVGTGTIYLSADQLPMFMQPEIRRVAILLTSIPMDARYNIQLVRKRDPRDRTTEYYDDVELILDERDLLLANTVRMRRRASGAEFTVPADSISRIWKNWDGRWVIRASVVIVDHQGGSIAVPVTE